MSARGFGSVLSAGAVVGAALGFYLVSLRVASERAALEEVETRIAMTQRDNACCRPKSHARRLASLSGERQFIRLSAPPPTSSSTVASAGDVGRAAEAAGDRGPGGAGLGAGHGPIVPAQVDG